MTGTLRFNDVVSFSYLDSNWSKVKDNYENQSTNSQTVNDNILGNQLPGSTNGLIISIAATHSGIVTRNNGFYLPERMKKGTSTFTDNFGKPILLHHKDEEDSIGRAIDAKYVDTSGLIQDKYKDLEVKNSAGKVVGVINDVLIKDFVNNRMPFGQQVDVVRNIFSDSLLKDKNYSGLGYINLIANITDKEAIQKLLDGRYITGSVGASTNKAICSVCKEDWTKEGPCSHRPGGVYEDMKCFIIAGDLEYDEYSFVNKPADRYSKVLQLEYNGNKVNIDVADDYKGRIYEVQLQFPQYDSDTKEVEGMDPRDAKNDSDLEIQDSVKDNNTSPAPDAEHQTEGAQDVADSTTKVEEEKTDTVETNKEKVEDKVESTTDFITRIINSTETLDIKDEERAYDIVVDEILDKVFADNVDKTSNDWEVISEQMEQYAASLEGEDEELKVEEEEIEDADKKPQDKPGGSNVGKYKTKGPYCGPSGGAPKGSYPVNTAKRAKAALAYARHAPNPSGIRKCVCRHYPSLPSCKDASQKKDVLLTKEQRDALPTSAFCGPGRTFPVKDEEHYRAVMSVLDKYDGPANLEDIRKVVERKGKARGFTYTKKDVTDNQVNDSMHHVHIMRAILSVLSEDSYAMNSEDKALTDEEKKALSDILKRLSSLVGKDNLQQVLYVEELAHNESALLDEVASLETELGEVRDRLEASQKEYNLLYSDMETLQDSLVNEKASSRKVKESRLKDLTILKDGKINEEYNYTDLSDSELDSEISRTLEVLDMEKITNKINDGMSRVPEGEIENPSEILDNNENQERVKISAESLKKIQQNWYYLRFSRGQETADAYLEDLKKVGLLPRDLNDTK